MTKKQHREIARMWSAAIIYNVGMDSFDSNIDTDASGKIVNETQHLAKSLLKNRPLLHTLPEIIEYVLNK